MFSQIVGALLGSQSQQQSDELFKIQNGTLQHNSDSKEASLTVRRTSAPFHYELVASPAGDDLEEFTSLICPELEFYRTPDGQFKFTIDDQSFVYTPQTNKHTVDFFETSILECIYELLNGKSRDTASMADLEALKFNPKASKKSLKTIGKPTAVQSKSKKPQVKTQKLSGTSVLKSRVSLYLYDAETMNFVQQAQDCYIELIKLPTPFCYWLSVGDGKDQLFLSQPVDSSMNAVFNDEHKSFIWVYQDEENGVAYSWSVKFDVDYVEFKQVFGKCVFEAVNKESFEKITDSDRQYLTRGYAIDDVEMTDAQEAKSSDEEDEESESDYKTPRKGKQFMEFGNNAEPSSANKNTNLAVSYVHNKSFVTRGNIIGVFKNDHDDVEFSTTIQDIKRPNDTKSFSPHKVMLHERDSSMILMDKNNPNSLYRMDLEYGKVVDEWKIDENREVKDFTHDTKYGQMDASQTFVGISHNALFRIDPRQSGTKLVESQMNQYKSKNEFSAATTTGKGDLVVASDKGDIRLYNSIDKRAKTHLPGYGDPIIGVDVTEDGKLVLATCKTYLLLIPTEAQNDAGVNIQGFSKSLGAFKPIPKRLQLKPEHVAWMNAPVSFTQAHFNTEPGSTEKSIVTSSGQYVITWNLRRVKQGHLTDYSIKHYQDRVVADRFMHGSNNVIVALEDDVTVASKKQFSTPVKAFEQQRRSSRNLH